MTDGPETFRYITILALAAGLSCFLLGKQIWSLAHRAHVLTGLMAAVAVGGALASVVHGLVPLSIVPAALLVLAPVALWWLVRGLRRASAVINQTIEEFATPNSYELDSPVNGGASVSTRRTALH